MANDKDAAKEQKGLFDKLEKNDVKVADDKAKEMKENIINNKGGANYLGIGIHEVTVTAVELREASTGTMGIKFLVENQEGRSDASMWLSEGALPYTIENVSRLMVHNAKEENKDKARTHMSNIASAKELFDTVKQTIDERAKGKTEPFTCYLSIRESKNGDTYTNKDGEVKPSIERNLLSYKPKASAAQNVAKAVGGAEVVPEDELNMNDLPF